MRFITIVVPLMGLVTALASPLQSREPHYEPCDADLYSNPKCCAVNVVQAADLDCHALAHTPTSAKDFEAICSEKGAKPQCCGIPVVSGIPFKPVVFVIFDLYSLTHVPTNLGRTSSVVPGPRGC